MTRRRLAFPVLAVVGFALLVALGWNGSSASFVRPEVEGPGPDPQQVFGRPNFIRSDEWMVITPLTVHQQGADYQQVTPRAMGGQDVSTFSALPYRDWSVLFRPQFLGFLVLPFEQAFAFHWWFPALVLALGTYGVVLGICPRRPGMAAAAALGVVFAPFVQWWFLTITTGSLGWAAGLVALYIALDRARDRRVMAACAVGLAYASAAFLMVLYPAFQIPCALVALAAIAGWTWRAGNPLGLRGRLRRLGLAAGSAAAGAAVFGLFLATRWHVIQLQAHTDYPGSRVVETGGGNLVWLFSGFMDGRLTPRLVLPALLGVNASESSTFVFVGFFLVVPAAWLLARARRLELGIDGLLVALVTGLTLLLAVLLVPGVDGLARLLMLSSVPAQRLFIALGFVSLLLVAATVRELDRQQVRPPWVVVGLAGGLACAAHAYSGRRTAAIAPALSGGTARWAVLALMVTALVVLAARGYGAAALGGLAALSLLASYRVNPVYDGVYDARNTQLGRAIVATDRDDPGAWISIGSIANQAVLTAQPVAHLSGTALYPNFAAWSDYDAAGANRIFFNRYAKVEFSPERDIAPLALGAPDWVILRFDGCGPFAQRRVEHVLSTEPLTDPCVRLHQKVVTNGGTSYIYDLVRTDQPFSPPKVRARSYLWGRERGDVVRTPSGDST